MLYGHDFIYGQRVLTYDKKHCIYNVLKIESLYDILIKLDTSDKEFKIC